MGAAKKGIAPAVALYREILRQESVANQTKSLTLRRDYLKSAHRSRKQLKQYCEFRGITEYDIKVAAMKEGI